MAALWVYRASCCNTVAGLHVGRVDHHRQEQAERVDHAMPLAVGDLLAGVVTPGPLFRRLDLLERFAVACSGIRDDRTGRRGRRAQGSPTEDRSATAARVWLAAAQAATRRRGPIESAATLRALLGQGIGQLAATFKRDPL